MQNAASNNVAMSKASPAAVVDSEDVLCSEIFIRKRAHRAKRSTTC